MSGAKKGAPIPPRPPAAIAAGARRANARLLAALLAAAAVLALAPAASSADSRIGEAGESAGGLSGPEGVAVSQKEAGELYVADAQNQRIDRFGPDGSFIAAFGWKVNASAPEEKLQVCTLASGCQRGESGEGPGQLEYSAEIAVDNNPGSASYGDLYVVDQRHFRVEKFGPAGEFLLMLGGGVDHTTGADLCTAADIESGDLCGSGAPGTGAAHFYKEEPPTEAGGFKSWGKEHSNSIAVGPGGTVYVGDYGRIQEFEPDGSFAGEFVLPVAVGEEPQLVTALAVDAAGNIFERSAVYGGEGQLRSQVPGVREYDSSHAFIHTFDAEEATSEPTHIALDAAGDLFLTDDNGSHLEPPTGVFQVRAYRPGGALYAVISTDQLAGSLQSPARVQDLAIGDNAAGLYASVRRRVGSGGSASFEEYVAVEPLPTDGAPAISEERVIDIEPKTATLRALVNPRGSESHYHFEYVDQASYETEGGFASPHTEPTPAGTLDPVNRIDPVEAAISGLLPGTLYHYRLAAGNSAGNSEGAEQTFETLPAVSVRDLTTQTVGPELATLKFELNPNNGSPSTAYTLHYGLDAGYSTDTVQGSIALGGNFVKRSATLSGLQPNTTYHYQLIANNENGEVKTADQTFTTELSAAEERDLEDCSNANLREETHSLTLPDCRAYEQVSQPFKAGYAVGESLAFPPIELAPGGERAAYPSGGTFAGSEVGELGPYLARRTPAGWTTESPLKRPAGPDYQAQVAAFVFNGELDSWLAPYLPASNIGEGLSGVSNFVYYLGRSDGSYLQASPTIATLSGAGADPFPRTIAASADGSHLFFSSGFRLLPEDTRADDGDPFGQSRIYELSGIGTAAPTLRFLAAVPLGLANVPGKSGTCALDAAFGNQTNSTTADGSTLFYDAPLEIEPGRCGVESPNKAALFARTGAAPAVQLSAPPPSQCHSPSPCAGAALEDAHFYGNSPDGARAWFLTRQPLIDSDTDAGNDLYLAQLEDGELKGLLLASAGESTAGHPTPGRGAEVKGVLRVSDDGNRVYFVAAGVLTDAENALHQSALQGAANLYALDAASGEMKFVAELCSGPEESGSVKPAPSCPPDLDTQPQPGNRNDSALWNLGASNERQLSLSPGARFLLLRSYARLVPGDTDNAADLYRYDFQSGQLLRVSFGRNGNDADGNDDRFDARIPPQGARQLPDAIAEDASRSISADGSLIVFSTAAPLVSYDTNEASDIYLWEETGHGTCERAAGCISLLSDGLDPHGALNGVLSSSGRDIVFLTPRSLLSGDTDGQRDVYDARVEGGFHAQHPPTPCAGPEACLAAPTPPAPTPAFGTETAATGGNERGGLRCAKGKVRVKRHGQIRCVAKKHHKAKPHRRRPQVAHNDGGAK